MANGGKYAIGEILSWRNYTSILLASSQPVLASTYIGYCSNATSQTHATFCDLQVCFSGMRTYIKIEIKINGANESSIRVKVDRQIYPKAGFIREISLDIDSTKL